ncbi:hypothetical protein B0J18DRAFT_433935 [Chaetomium sp. MPI-SDFR-AT-0129]|nr:hypothetical protein B0J18DRAFT_433935 [Chaetomium sp. MPI-SDFR-AT-0129]
MSWTSLLLPFLGFILPFQGQLVSALPLGPLSTTSTSTAATGLNTLPLLSLTKRLQQATETTLLRHAFYNTHHLPRQLSRRADTFLSGATATTLFVVLIVVSILIGVAVGSIAICGLDWKQCFKRSEPREDLGETREEGVGKSEKAAVGRVEKDRKGKNREGVKGDEVKESKGWLKKAVYR